MTGKSGIQKSRKSYTPAAGAGIQPMPGEITLNDKTSNRIDLIVRVDRATRTRDYDALQRLQADCAGIDILSNMIAEALA